MQTGNNISTLNDSSYTSFLYYSPDINKTKLLSDSIQSNYDSLNSVYLFAKINQKKGITISDTNNLIRPSFFSHHMLKRTSSNPKALNSYPSDWVFILLFISSFLFVWSYYSYSKRFKQILSACFTNRGINQLSRDGDLFKERISIALFTVYVITFSMFCFQLMRYFFNIKAFGFYNIVTFLKILASIFILLFVKWMISKFIAHVFKNQIASNIFLLNSLVFNIVSGVFLLPLVILNFYSNPFISKLILPFVVIMLLLFNTIRYIRYIIIGISYSKFSQLYLFLYLCTLEILPVLILIKISIGLISKYL